jgi:hypothetical protein
MIWHKAITKDLAKWKPFLSYFFEKKFVIPVIEEYGNLIIAPVVNMIYVFKIKMHKGIFCLTKIIPKLCVGT